MADDHDWRPRGFTTRHAALKRSSLGDTGDTIPTPTITSRMKVAQHRSKTANRLASFLNVSNHFARDERRKMRDSKASSLNVDWSHLAEEHKDYQPDFIAMGEAVEKHVDAHPFDDLPANLITNVLHVFSDYRKVLEQRDELSQDLAAEVAKHEVTKALLEQKTKYPENSERDIPDAKTDMIGKATSHEISHSGRHDCHCSTTRMSSCGSSSLNVDPKDENSTNVTAPRTTESLDCLNDGAEEERPNDVQSAILQVRLPFSGFPTNDPRSTAPATRLASQSRIDQGSYHSALAFHSRGYSFLPGDDRTLSRSTCSSAPSFGQDKVPNTSNPKSRLSTVDPVKAIAMQAPLLPSPSPSYRDGSDSRDVALNSHGSGSSVSSERGACGRYPHQKHRTLRPFPSTNEMAIAAARAARKSSSSIGIPIHGQRKNIGSSGHHGSKGPEKGC